MKKENKNKFPFKLLTDLRRDNLKDKVAILRADFNVPIKAGRVLDDYRIKKIAPTLKFLKQNGAKVIILSHQGNKKESLKPIVEILKKYGPVEFSFLEKIEKRETKKDILLLENIRRYSGEERNDPKFSARLARLGDLYVNDAFSASHRYHASVVGLPNYLPSFAGPLFVSEYVNLAKIFLPKKPFIFILGGAKFETKVPLIKKFINKADKIFIVGALAHTFFKKIGYEIGQSLVSKKKIDIDKFLKSKKIILPSDVMVKTGKKKEIKKPEDLTGRDVICDAGPETVEIIGQEVLKAETILWNGPLGQFENGFDWATKAVAKTVARSKAYSIVGGGDTVAAIEKLKINQQFDFVSTAGGAMIDFLATGTLPGIEALKKSKKKLN